MQWESTKTLLFPLTTIYGKIFRLAFPSKLNALSEVIY